jgi:hypothetical protein
VEPPRTDALQCLATLIIAGTCSDTRTVTRTHARTQHTRFHSFFLLNVAVNLKASKTFRHSTSIAFGCMGQVRSPAPEWWRHALVDNRLTLTNAHIRIHSEYERYKYVSLCDDEASESDESTPGESVWMINSWM